MLEVFKKEKAFKPVMGFITLMNKLSFQYASILMIQFLLLYFPVQCEFLDIR